MVRHKTPSSRSLLYWFGAPIIVVVMAACYGNATFDPWAFPLMCPIDDDGRLEIDKECCPCPWSEMCPDGWPEVPAYCRTNCEPGQPMECCQCPTSEWCDDNGPKENFKEPDWCKTKFWRVDGGTDAGNVVCPNGTCVPKTPEGWMGPATLYDGLDIDLPACPEDTTMLVGYEEPPPPTCYECTCSTPKSSCGLSPEWTISSRTCDNLDGGMEWDFSPSLDWDGTCNGEKAMPAGKLCGPDGFCAKSITISPPTVEQIDKSCTPSVKEPADSPTPKLHGQFNAGPDLTARVCISKQASDLPTCGVDNENVCAEIPGSMACVVRIGDHSCPSGWPQKHLYFQEVDENRSCSECSCGPVDGASCTRKYQIFKDAMCTDEYEAMTYEDSGLPKCSNISPGMAVGSKAVELVENVLGACAPSGGEVIGEVKLKDPFTVCCVGSDM